MPPIENKSPMTFKGKSVGVYMTSRACKPNGRLRTLDHLPEEFHKFITVVTEREYATKLKGTYSELAPIWVTKPSFDSAAKKRRLIMTKAPEDIVILLNDDVTLNVFNPETMRYQNASVSAELWWKHFRVFLQLTQMRDAVGLHDRAFSKQYMEAKGFFKENSFLGAFFTFSREVRETIQLGRLNYYEDIDYSLQILSNGFSTCQYLGIVFSHPNTKPTRQHSDRTKEVQDRDRERLIGFFPEAVRMRPPEKLREDLNIDIYVSYSAALKAGIAYADKKHPDRGNATSAKKPPLTDVGKWLPNVIKEKVKKVRVYKERSSSDDTGHKKGRLNLLFICHGNINRSAAAHIITEKYFPGKFNVKSAGVKDRAGGERTTKRMLSCLAEVGIEHEGLRSSKATPELIEWADYVFYMDRGNRSRLIEQFPESRKKLRLLAKYVELDKIKDPAFSGIEEFRTCVQNVRKAVKLLGKRYAE